MKKKISVVTGGAGFIGSHLVEKLLQKNHKVIVIDDFSTGRIKNLKKVKKKIKLVKLDLAKSKNLKKIIKHADFVFHLAGLADIVPSIEKPEKYYEANVNGTLKLLNSINIKNLKKFIFAASASCYGIPKKFPTDEKNKIQTLYPYAFTKWSAENLVLHWHKIYNLPVISLRFFNVYGLRSRTTGAYGAVFGVFLRQKISNQPLTIVGNGKQTRDFINVKDLVDAIYLITKSKANGEIFNLGTGKETSVNQIAKIIGGKKVFIEKRPGEPDRSLADIRKIKKFINWAPKIKIKEGIQEMLVNISYWKNAPLWTPKKIKTATKAWFNKLK